MKKGDIIELGKHLAKEYFRDYLETINGDFGLLDNPVEIIGFKEYEEEDENLYRMVFRLKNYSEVYCVLIYDRNTRRLHSDIYKRIDI